MRLSSRARYALRSMIVLARCSANRRPVSLGAIAERTHISRGYLEQVAIQLKNASLVRGVSGRGGGYVLTRPADEIKAGEVIEAVIGPINIVECVRNPGACLITDVCECRKVYMLINERILSALNSFTIADLTRAGYEGDECLPSVSEGSETKFFARGSPCMSR